MSNLITDSGNLVTWIGKDGGHKVGTKVVIDNEEIVRQICRDGHIRHYTGIGTHNLPFTKCILLKHEHTGELEFVEAGKLSEYQTREQRTVTIGQDGYCSCAREGVTCRIGVLQDQERTCYVQGKRLSRLATKLKK